MTSEEKQEIINAVLAALRTNSKSIDQLTPVSEMSEVDFLELNGGRKVSYGVLFANHMSNDDAQEAWEYLDTHKVDKDSRGLVEVHQATVVYLDAMGNLDGHSLNGSEGLEYRTDTKLIYDFPGGLFGAPKAGAVYISKNNLKKFVWNGTDLEELKADECPLFVDYSEPVSFATLPVGGSYYVPSSHKIAVKIDASNTKTYDPLPDALYFFRDKGMIYTWKSSTNKWVPAGSDIKVVNNLTDGGEDDALSAEQGKVLKGLIDDIGTGSIAAFAQYAVFESVSALPATGVATTGYIVGNHIYAYVGTGGDTADGAYQDLGALEAAGVSLTTNGDGTFTVHAGGNDYTVNLNHTHENMAKLIVCEESDLPSTLDMDTIYAQVDNATDPGEIQSLWIAGLEFVGGGGGGADDGLPKMSTPKDGNTISMGTYSGSAMTKEIPVRAKNLNYGGSTTGLTVEAVGTGLTLTYGQTTGTSVTIPQADAMIGAQLTINYSGTGALSDGELRFKQGNSVLAVVVVVVEIPSELVQDTAWCAASGENFSAPETQAGYCTTPFYKLTHDSSSNIDYVVKAGYVTPTDLARGLFVVKTNLADAQTQGAYLQNSDPRRKQTNDNRNLINYLSATFKTSEWADCYIYDYIAGAYLFAGANVDTSTPPTMINPT